MLVIPYHRGQKKPWNSIPRINWSHPLARGLVSYGYDAGSGPIDLVTGGQRVIGNTANPPFGGPKSSKYGSALSSIQQSGNVTLGLFNLPTSPDIVSSTTVAPYSFACGFMFTATPPSFTFSQLYLLCSPTNTVAARIGVAPASTTDFGFTFGAGGVNNTAAGLNKINEFNTALGVALTDTTTNCYVNGVLVISPSPAVITTTTVAGARPQFHGLPNQASQTLQSGFVYYGAVWKGRALTDSEARLLHDDPYCFLIYPEDEIFSTLVGAGVILLLGDHVLDNGLNSLDIDCDKIFICAATPTSYADATSGANSLGNKNWGAGNAFAAPAAKSGGGRQIASIAITNGSITANGTAAVWAAVDSANSRLLASGPLTGGTAVTTGQTFTLAAMTFGIPNVS